MGKGEFVNQIPVINVGVVTLPVSMLDNCVGLGVVAIVVAFVLSFTVVVFVVGAVVAVEETVVAVVDVVVVGAVVVVAAVVDVVVDDDGADVREVRGVATVEMT